MRKISYLIAGGIVLVCLSGCDSTAQELSCTLSRNDKVNGYTLESTYNVTAKDNVVEKVVTKEAVTTDDAELLSTFENQFDTTYSAMNEAYGGYTFKVTKKDNTVTSDVTIDYTKVDLDTLAKDEPTVKNLMNNNNQITLDKLKQSYESMGATCK